MKKLFLLLITCALLSSCENNEGTETNSDPIIGNWQLHSTLDNGVEVSTECERNSTVLFKSDGFVTATNYEGDINCSSETETFNWSNLGNSVYSVDGDNQTITFSENNTKFSFTEIDTYNGMTDTFTIIYQKIE